MADWRVVCVAVCLVVAAVAAQSTEDRSETELEGLLSAMKRYLHAEKDDDDVSSRQSAHDDVRTVYDPCMTSELVYDFILSRNSELSTLYNAVESGTEMTIVTTP